VYVPATSVGTFRVAVAVPDVVIVKSDPVLRMYVKVYGALPSDPVNVMTGCTPFWQTELLSTDMLADNAVVCAELFLICVCFGLRDFPGVETRFIACVSVLQRKIQSTK
jgi:hypothetical protein